MPRFEPARRTADGSDLLRRMFARFRRILELNTRVLATMAEMEQALGGEYVFDRAFLESSVRAVAGNVQQIVYSLNAISGDRHVALFDRYEAIRNILDDLLAGGPGPYGAMLCVSRREVGWEHEPLVGLAEAALAGATETLGLSQPDGCLLTSAGVAAWRGAGRSAAEKALAEALAGLFARLGGPRRLRLDVLPIGPALAGARPLPPIPAAGPETAAVLAAVGAAVADLPAAGSFALRLAAAPALALCGEVLGPESGRTPPGSLTVTAAPSGPSGPIGPVERYRLRRAAPHDLIRSEIAPKDPAAPLPGNGLSLRPATGGLLRGSALLAPGQLRCLAAAATALETASGGPAVLTWGLSAAGELLALDLDLAGGGPAGEESPEELENLSASLARAEVLLSGGSTAQSGVAAGVVAYVAEDADPEAVPAGAVVVARAATPRLSRALRRASAVVTEVGAVAGHLATIAREYRIPALFGAAGALARLPEGQLVTVDAGGGVVYRGLIEALLSFRAAGQELSPADPEYVTLRRLLGFIRPLNLTDPAASEFSAAGCRTFHDIIHYCHERAVEELIAIQERHPELDGAAARRLDPAALGVPLDLSVLDLDGGVAPGAGQRLTPADIRSRPLSALLAGLCRPEAWSRQPASLGLRDILSGLGRAGGLGAGPGYAGRNLAIAARTYCNVSLRLGYHFNVIDSFLGEDPGQNYVYYRFVGGFADPVRRSRRVELIRRVLEARDFKVEVRGDLLTARFKIGTPAELSSVLARLGLLTGFTRQLDLSLTADGDVAALAAEFAALAEAAPMPGAGGEG